MIQKTVSLLLLCLCTFIVFKPIDILQAKKHKSRKGHIHRVFQNKCIEDLGCFYTGPPFYHPYHRPLTYSPTDDLQTTFLLYNPKSKAEPQVLKADEKSMSKSTLQRQLPIKILIHGYRTILNKDNIKFKIKDELLKEDKYNVIVVNWTAHNKYSYQKAIANARVIGAQTAKLINYHVEHMEVNPKNVHVIGHSLGGQLAGWVGERVKGLGRITALDPAGPYFQQAENIVRLDTTDANFVDVIHTNGGNALAEGYGIDEAIGHFDFYPNGGQLQPGCIGKMRKRNKTVWKVIQKGVANLCSHSRAEYLFLESINNCKFTATECNSYDDYKDDKCPRNKFHTVEMGLNAAYGEGLRKPAKFFLKTTAKRPYCIK